MEKTGTMLLSPGRRIAAATAGDSVSCRSEGGSAGRERSGNGQQASTWPVIDSTTSGDGVHERIARGRQRAGHITVEGEK